MQTRKTPSPPPSLVAGALAAAASFGALVLATFAAVSLDLGFAGAYGTVVFLFLATMTHLSRRPEQMRVVRATALGLATTSLWILLGTGWTLSEPIVSTHFRCGTGMVGMMIVGPFFFSGGSGLAAMLASSADWMNARTLKLRPELGLLVVAVAAAVGLGSAVHSARLQGIDPGDYVESLPIVAHVDAEASGPQEIQPGLSLEAGCDEYSCNLSGDALPSPLRLPVEGRLDAERGLLILQEEGNGGRSAIRLEDHQPVDIMQRDIEALLRTPPHWVASGVAGLVTVLFALFMAGSFLRKRKLANVARAGRVNGFGTFTLASSALQLSTTLKEGPACVVASTRCADYRSNRLPADAVVLSGTPTERAQVCTSKVEAWLAIALCSALLFGAPLWL